MTVGDLIAALKKHDPELLVRFVDEEEFRAEDEANGWRLVMIVSQVESKRGSTVLLQGV
jgi:hypothetical protein